MKKTTRRDALKKLAAGTLAAGSISGLSSYNSLPKENFALKFKNYCNNEKSDFLNAAHKPYLQYLKRFCNIGMIFWVQKINHMISGFHFPNYIPLYR